MQNDLGDGFQFKTAIYIDADATRVTDLASGVIMAAVPQGDGFRGSLQGNIA